MNKIKDLVGEYGPIALAVWFALFFLVLFVGAGAASLGFGSESAASVGAAFAIGYGAAQLSKPFRIVITLALTPVVARWLRRNRPPEDGVSDVPAEIKPEAEATG